MVFVFGAAGFGFAVAQVPNAPVRSATSVAPIASPRDAKTIVSEATNAPSEQSQSKSVSSDKSSLQQSKLDVPLTDSDGFSGRSGNQPPVRVNTGNPELDEATYRKAKQAYLSNMQMEQDSKHPEVVKKRLALEEQAKVEEEGVRNGRPVFIDTGNPKADEMRYDDAKAKYKAKMGMSVPNEPLTR